MEELEQYKTWHQRYYQLAKVYSTWSKDPRKKVGCVLTINRIQVGQGYNGFPKPVEDTAERLNDRELKNKLMIHAERNALRVAEDKAEVAYIYPCLPCSSCLNDLIHAGVKLIVTGPLDDASSWSQPLVMEIIKEVGINLLIMEDD